MTDTPGGVSLRGHRKLPGLWEHSSGFATKNTAAIFGKVGIMTMWYEISRIITKFGNTSKTTQPNGQSTRIKYNRRDTRPRVSAATAPGKRTPREGCPYIYAAAFNIFSIKIPYPIVGSFTNTWVTAPTIFPSCMIGLPLTLMSSRGQKNFVFFCGFYAFLQVNGGFLHIATDVLKLT